MNMRLVKKSILTIGAGFFICAASYAQSDLQQFVGTGTDFANLARTENAHSRMITGSGVNTFNPKEETVGHRYISADWMHGSVVDMKDTLFNNPSFLYNYDKMTQSLLLTQDRQQVIEIYKDQIKSFTLKNNDLDVEYVRNPLMPEGPFLQVITSGKKYILSQTTTTKFIKSDYSTNGIAESGNRYDEYKDNYTFYISEPGLKNIRKVELKRKAIKNAFLQDEVAVKNFLNKSYTETLDGNFLRALVENLNNN